MKDPEGGAAPSPLRDAGIAVVYLLAASLLQMLARAFWLEPGAVIWYGVPALTFAYALAAPRRMLGLVFLAPLPHRLTWEIPLHGLLPVLAVCLSHGTAYGLGARLLLRSGFDPTLQRGRDLALLLLFVAMAPLAFALPASASLAARVPAFGPWPHRLPFLWLEDVVGLLALAPPLLVFVLPRWRSPGPMDLSVTPLRVLEVLVQSVALAGVSTLVLTHPSRDEFPLAYVGFLPLLWVALRWGLRGATAGVLLFILAMGGQYVALGLPIEGLSDLQLLLIVMTATTLVVGHLVDARREHHRTLLQQGVQLATLMRGTGAVPFEMEARTGRCLLLGRGALLASGHPTEAWLREPFWASVVDPLHLPRLQAYFQGLLDGTGPHAIEVPLQGGGPPRWMEISGSALGVGEKVGGFFHDVSARRAMEEHLQASEAHFRQLVDQSLIPTAVHQDGRFVYVNEATLRLLGYAREELLHQPVDFLIHPEDMEDSLMRREKALRGETLLPTERRLVRKDGSTVVVDLLTIACQHEGRPAAQVLAVDLTAHKAVEQGLRDRLKEKELLIREIHHRVKNNLQVVSSLLRLQGLLHPSPELGRALEEAQGRIQAIAAVHQRLHQVASLAPEELEDYLRRLVAQLVQTFAGPRQVSLRLQVEPLALGADQLVPLGLVVHELVLNALKHAFAETGGTLTLDLRREGGEVLLRIADDGPGLPPDLDPFRSGGLGFQMARALADQLKGRLEVEATSGAAFRLRFPLPPQP